MKYLSFILSIYMLVLLVTPCCAFDECADDETFNTELASHPGDDKKENGTCSPFFNCEGCAAYSQIVHPFLFEIITSSVSPQYTDLIPQITDGIRVQYWQPPRLG